MIPLAMKNDANGNNSFAAPFSDTINALSLGVATAESATVPAGANFCIFSYTTDIYVNSSATATVPGDTTDGTASELNPTIRQVTAGDTLSIISPAASVVTLSYFS